jgi:two-component system, probable response regulator PhcQ
MSTTPDNRKYALLYVDDEEQALKYFRKVMDKDFRVLTATGVNEASAILDQEGATIGVVITDQRMPGLLGVELLKRVRAQWPNIVRLLITAYSDIDSAVDAVNSGAIYKYITKPADLRALRDTLQQAMELFMANGAQDTLLHERIEVIQRMVVAERVRSLALMAGGISHHLRNSMTALTCFLEETAPARPGEPPRIAAGADAAFAQQLWTLAQKEREHLLQIVHRVGQGVGEAGSGVIADVSAADLLGRSIDPAIPALKGKPVQIECDPQLPMLKLDAQAVARLIKILLTYADRLNQTGGRLNIAATPVQVLGFPGVKVQIRGEGPTWSEADIASFFTPFAFPANDPSDLGLDLLSAFSIAYEHGGDIVVQKSAPAGPGFELLLPANPADVHRPILQEGMTEKLFTQFQPPGSPRTQGGRAA